MAQKTQTLSLGSHPSPASRPPIQIPGSPAGDSALFSGISSQDLSYLIGCLKGREQSFGKGALIELENDTIQRVGIVLEGQVQMIKTDHWGNEDLLTYVQPGEVFAESFAIQPDSSSYVSFRAAKPSRVLFLDLQPLLHVCERQCPFHQKMVQNLFAQLALKNQQLMEKINITSKPSLREKILAYLSLQAQKQGKQRYIEVPLSRQDLAAYLHTNRSALSRELSRMKDEGLLDYDRSTFTLPASDAIVHPS